jgi:hypothetical protein
MTVPLNHMKERLSYAYASAIVARAGAALTPVGPDYGTDGFIQAITELPNGKYTATGHILSCQLKATTTGVLDSGEMVYDMDVEAYNKLASWEGASPCILVVLRLPVQFEDCLALDEEQLLLKNCCYWTRVQGPPSTNLKFRYS